MKTYSNINDLKREINKSISNAINGIAVEIRVKLDEIIERVVYSSDSKYDRTYDFKNRAWITELSNSFANEIIASIEYHGDKMSSPSYANPFSHGNFSKGIDRRERLASIINFGGIRSDYDMRRFNARPFWTEFINWINANWNNIAKKYLKAQGLDVFFQSSIGGDLFNLEEIESIF